MTSQDKVPSEELLAGRRALEGMEGVMLLNDWTWDAHVNKWVLHCRLSPSVPHNSPIPAETDWYILVDEAYPWGSIKLYPAKENGIVRTFHHQSFNSYGKSEVPWRDGDICLDTTVRVLGRHGYDTEPYGAHERLRWRFQRAIDWLEAASRDELVLSGEPFELPAMPQPRFRMTVAFSEGRGTFAGWQDTAQQAGLVDLSFFNKESGLLLTRCFRSSGNKELLTPNWGAVLQDVADEPLRGIWLRIREVPVLYPWQIPTTWQELRKACRAQDVDIDDLLGTVVEFVRDGKQHVALLGYPIPARVGDLPCQMHWQAFMMPRLSFGTQTAKGFRANERGYWQRDRTEVLLGEAPVDWLASENWHAEQVSTRGRLPEPLISRRLLLLGAGAAGSALAELLVRGGVQALTIMDEDRLEAGNLVRHSLTLDQLKCRKAGALAEWLNKLTPFASVQAIDTNFPPVAETHKSLVQECEIVIDCTARDEVLHYLDSFPWDDPKLFFSISLGLQARRLFVFIAYGDKFPHSRFSELIAPWLMKEMEEHKGEEWPREGIGCWHPIFPARVDDVRMLVSIALKHIESATVVPPAEPELVVFEQHYEDDRLINVSQVYA